MLMDDLKQFDDVREYLDNMNIMMDVDTVDQISEQNILNSCTTIVLNGLRIIGIDFHVPIGELLDNYYDANSIAYLAKLFIPEVLVRTLVENNLVDLVEPILDNSSNEAIRDIICLMADEIGGEEYIRVREFLFDKVVSTDEYVASIRALLEKENVNDLSDKSDVPSEFIDVLNESRQYIEKLILKVSALTGVDHSKLEISKKITCDWLFEIDVDIIQAYLSTKSKSSLAFLKDAYLDKVRAFLKEPVTGNEILSLFIVTKTIGTMVPVMNMDELRALVPDKFQTVLSTVAAS